MHWHTFLASCRQKCNWGAHYGGQKAILRTGRETLLEEMKFVLQSPLPPTVFSLTEDLDKEKKKSSNTWQERLFSPCNTDAPLLTLTQTFVFVTVSTTKSSELNHWLCAALKKLLFQGAAAEKGTHWTAAGMWFYHFAWILIWTRKEKELDRFQEKWQP